tara:strand:+ start:3231 stop:3902 length:672 start_codon:yes stop_codon:yes gene_type:complete
MAMIMDGNTRWSKKNNVDIKQGYTRGLKNIKNVINVCLDKNIKNLTLYALSSENIKRSSVRIIFDVLVEEYKNIFEEFDLRKNVKIKIFGDRKNLPIKIINIFKKLETDTLFNNKLNLNIAFNYGTDQELLSIVKNFIKNSNTKIHDDNTINKLIREYMYLNDTPDPDLLIRTGGFQRLSNFLLLKLSYTELFFTKTLWPDLSKKELLNIINSFYSIERKYGL